MILRVCSSRYVLIEINYRKVVSINFRRKTRPLSFFLDIKIMEIKTIYCVKNFIYSFI